MTDKRALKTTANEESVTAEQAAQARALIESTVADQAIAAAAAAIVQCPSSPNGVRDQAHRAVRTIMSLMVDKSGGPVAHVMLGDGRTAEFKSRPIIIEETSQREASAQILYLVINGLGEVFVDAKTGYPIVVPEIPLTVQLIEDPQALVSIEEAAQRASVSASTIKRTIRSGALIPHRIGTKSIRLRAEDVQRWIESGRPKETA